MTDASEAPGPMRFGRALIIAAASGLALQTGAALVWAGATGERIRHLENSVENAAPVNERLARLEAEAASARAALERIERRLDALDRSAPR